MIHSTVSAPKGEKTKYRLAESMKECMKTTPVEEITVRQICEICGVTRQTFYRNFLDKYDLINWYFDKLLTKSFEHMGRGTTVFDSLEKKFTYIQKEKAFFAAAFTSSMEASGLPKRMLFAMVSENRYVRWNTNEKLRIRLS